MTLTVLQLSDIHYPSYHGELVCDRDPVARLRTVLEACETELEQIDAVLLTGDQVHHGNVNANRELRAVLARFGVPILAAPGNHDDPDSHRVIFGPTGATDIGTWRVLSWDSCLPNENHGRINVTAVSGWIGEHDERPTLLALHHPPVPPTSNPVFRLENGEQLLGALAQYAHVRAVVSGHAHTPFVLHRDGIMLLGGPAVCVPFLHGDSGELTIGAGGPTGARAIFLDDDGGLRSKVIAA